VSTDEAMQDTVKRIIKRYAGCDCMVPDFELAEFEMAPAVELIAKHPNHERIIGELTRH
jgi:predicted cupin superfamily sugar epimerase